VADDKTLTIVDLLDLTTWTVFDVDPQGRVLAGSDASGSIQLVEIDPDGVHTPLTALPGACSGRYLPGSHRVVVVEHDTGGDERAQLSLLPVEPPPGKPVELDGLDPLVRDPAYIHALVDVRDDEVVYRTNRRNGVDFDVVVRRVSTGAERLLYDAGGHVTNVHVDGDTVAVTISSLMPNSTQVKLVHDGVIRDVTAADDHALHTSVSVLPGTGTVLMSSNHGRDFRAVVQVDPSGAWRTLVAADDHDVSVHPSPDGGQLLIVRHVDGAHQLSLHGPDGVLRTALPLPGSGVATPVWSADGAALAIGLSTPTSPGDVLVVDLAAGTVRTLVDGANQATARTGGRLSGRLVEPLSVGIPTRDGETIPCFVYLPPEPEPEQAPAVAGSVVVNIHGGPESQAQRQFSPVSQGLAAAGHIVLVPNVRGSTGYGKRWYSMDDVRLRLESVRDLVDIRAWVPTIGGDPERVALYGGSYGGYMVLAGLAMHPGLWAAGVDIVGMSSLVTFLENTSAYRRAVREREYGTLAHDREFLHAASPLTYLSAMDTPLFVIHGANDPRVPLSESEQIKAALDAKGVPCTLRVYVDEGHGLAKRVNRLDAYPAVVAFLAEHLSRPAPG
jgi:dipeptidyl aminopeptidase/acylaminoacyl peptidase